MPTLTGVAVLVTLTLPQSPAGLRATFTALVEPS
jgi:hypothetical protein